MNWNFTQSPWNNPTPEADQASNEAANTEPPLSPEYVRLLGKLRAGDRYSLILLPFDNIPQATVDEALRRGDAVKAGEYYLRASTQLLTRLGTEEAQAGAASEASIIPDIKTATPDWGAEMWQEQMSAASPHQPEEAQASGDALTDQAEEPVQARPLSPRAFAAQWLTDLLQEPRWVEDLQRWAQEDGISRATLKRAKKAIGAKSCKSAGFYGGGDPRWFWRLG